MTKVRSLWPRRRGGKNGAADTTGTTGVDDGAGTNATTDQPVASARADDRIEATHHAVCLRACARYEAESAAVKGDRKRTELIEKLRHLLDVHAREKQALAAAHPESGKSGTGKSGKGKPAGKPGPAPLGVSDALFDALLAVGSKALECDRGRGGAELKLALLVGNTVLTERGNSRAGWRLRARTLEAAGDEAAAVDAYERYLGLTADDRFGVAPKLAGLRVATERQQDMLTLLARDCPRAENFAAGPAADVWAEGLALHELGEREQAEPRLVGALLGMGRAGRPVLELQEAVSRYLDLRITAAGGDASELRELIGLYADQRRNRMRPPVLDPTFEEADWIGLGELRNLIAGKSICLVANSARMNGSSLGAEIDAYDLVVRFSSYRTEAQDTGSRTDIHATSHEHGFNWDRPVTLRLAYGGVSEDWRYSLRDRLVPGAQKYVGDETLRWPLRHIGGVGWDSWPSIPTSGFNTLWMLDFLDVSPTLDLIGFDFYESGVHRLPGAMRIPVTSEREYTSEKAWVMERAQSVTDMRISLR
ncbi:glycosyltransferase family 29 protein [Streptomyces sp. NPDC088725]|uniref:glycosyltransferase family 29 protein n=1 Tax=Streptomyces sp. NPDC088725 TaxID=3365873 RepID=UPI0038104248